MLQNLKLIGSIHEFRREISSLQEIWTVKIFLVYYYAGCEYRSIERYVSQYNFSVYTNRHYILIMSILYGDTFENKGRWYSILLSLGKTGEEE